VLDEYALLSINYWVVPHDDELVAMAAFFRYEFDSPGNLWLTAFGTNPKARRQGVGRHLLDWMMLRAGIEGASEVRLKVSKAPIAGVARTLYRQVGFTEYLSNSTESADNLFMRRLVR
jgi:GNAT superfamily N-acetyltransferase